MYIKKKIMIAKQIIFQNTTSKDIKKGKIKNMPSRKSQKIQDIFMEN